MTLTREILNSHPVKNLKAELGKVKQISGYSKLNKNELIDLMMKNKDKFNHIEMYEKPPPKPRKKKGDPTEPKVFITEEPKKPAKKIKIIKGSYKQKLERVANDMYEKLITNLKKGTDRLGSKGHKKRMEILDEANKKLMDITDKQGVKLYSLGAERKDSTFFKMFRPDRNTGYRHQYTDKLKYDKLNVPNRQKYLDLDKKDKARKIVKIIKKKFIEGLLVGENKKKQREILQKLFREYDSSDKETQEEIRKKLDRFRKNLSNSKQARRDFFIDLKQAEQQLFKLQNPKLYRDFILPTRKQLEKDGYSNYFYLDRV